MGLLLLRLPKVVWGVGLCADRRWGSVNWLHNAILGRQDDGVTHGAMGGCSLWTLRLRRLRAAVSHVRMPDVIVESEHARRKQPSVWRVERRRTHEYHGPRSGQPGGRVWCWIPLRGYDCWQSAERDVRDIHEMHSKCSQERRYGRSHVQRPLCSLYYTGRCYRGCGWLRGPAESCWRKLGWSESQY